MHSTPQQNAFSQEKNDDLDLLLIAKNIIGFLKKNGIRLTVASIAGLFCGLILHFSLPKYYTSKLLIESTVINNTEARAVVDNWNESLRPSGYPYLMKEFNCNEPLLDLTLKIAAEPLNPQIEAQPGLIVNVSVRDTSILTGLQAALVQGFNNNDYVRRRVEQHRKATLDEIKKTDAELLRLDSTKEFFKGSVGSLAADKSPFILDVSKLSSQKVDLVEKKAALQERLEFIEGVQVVQSFTATRGPKPGLLTYLGAGLLGGFLIGYMFFWLRDLNQKISKAN